MMVKCDQRHQPYRIQRITGHPVKRFRHGLLRPQGVKHSARGLKRRGFEAFCKYLAHG